MKRFRIPLVALTVIFVLLGTGVAWADVASGPSLAVAGALGLGAIAVIGMVVAGVVIASILLLRRIVRRSRSSQNAEAEVASEDRQAS